MSHFLRNTFEIADIHRDLRETMFKRTWTNSDLVSFSFSFLLFFFFVKIPRNFSPSRLKQTRASRQYGGTIPESSSGREISPPFSSFAPKRASGRHHGRAFCSNFYLYFYLNPLPIDRVKWSFQMTDASLIRFWCDSPEVHLRRRMRIFPRY